MIDLKGQIQLFSIIGKILKNRAECTVIGGSAMLFYGAKENTKDVDLVFMKEDDFNAVKNALYESGFDEKKQFKIFRHHDIAETTPVMMEGRETRFDLFYREVICFKMTDSILSRVKEEHEFSNLTVKVIAPEDIILLKCATEREKDRVDALELIKKFNIDWNIIIEESQYQTKLGEMLFPVYLFDFLSELKEDLKAEIPKEVIKEIMKIGERAMENLLKEKKKH